MSQKVSETKFLGIIIDEKLSWDGQIKDLRRKLNYATASINRIKHSLPEHLHKDLYYTLFESHMSYCISVWGNIPKYKMANLFCTQKNALEYFMVTGMLMLKNLRHVLDVGLMTNKNLAKNFMKKNIPNHYLKNLKLCLYPTYILTTVSWRSLKFLNLEPPLPCIAYSVALIAKRCC